MDEASHPLGNYWIVEQIISKNMHQVDEDSKAYTMRLMDKLEQVATSYVKYKGADEWSRSKPILQKMMLLLMIWLAMPTSSNSARRLFNVPTTQ